MQQIERTRETSLTVTVETTRNPEILSLLGNTVSHWTSLVLKYQYEEINILNHEPSFEFINLQKLEIVVLQSAYQQFENLPVEINAAYAFTTITPLFYLFIFYFLLLQRSTPYGVPQPRNFCGKAGCPYSLY